MRQAFDWIKTHLITVIAGVVVVLSIGFLGYLWLQGSAFREQLTRRQSEKQQIVNMMRKSITIPAANPDDPPETINNVTINPVTIERLGDLYEKMNAEYQQIFEIAVEINRGNHLPMMGGLFPEPVALHLPFNAREEYRQLFPQLVQPYDEQASLPSLNAGMPPPMDEVERDIAELEREIIASMRPAGAATVELTPEDREKLAQEKRAKLLEILQERARQHHIYAVTDMNSSAFPFQVGEWSLGESGVEPDMEVLWEAQLEFWIQQDIVEALALANQVANPQMNVMEAPVKRLLAVEVQPGYVGLHSFGGMDRNARSTGYRSLRGLASTSDQVDYDPPANRLQQQRGSVPLNFYAGPTGRVSNALYDVRHVRLSVIVDVAQLPQLFDAISRVNFMTVLDCDLQDVDEYTALREGFVYGQGDAVRADLHIETLWLREWMVELMPDPVREYLGIDEPTERPRNETDPMYGPGGPPGGPGMMGRRP